jgi:hypothetical protein
MAMNSLARLKAPLNASANVEAVKPCALPRFE